jgi:hypothetical protein
MRERSAGQISQVRLPESISGWSIPLVFRKVEENYFSSQPKRAGTPYSLFIDYLAKKLPARMASGTAFLL